MGEYKLVIYTDVKPNTASKVLQKLPLDGGIIGGIRSHEQEINNKNNYLKHLSGGGTGILPYNYVTIC